MTYKTVTSDTYLDFGEKFKHQLDGLVYIFIKKNNPLSDACKGCCMHHHGKRCAYSPKCHQGSKESNGIFKPVYRNGKHLEG